jgi:hypothetical protein
MIKSRLNRGIARFWRRLLSDRRNQPIIFVVGFALVGASLLFLSRAATSDNINVNSDSGAQTGGYSSLSNAGAADGAAVRFGSQSWRAAGLEGGGYVNSIAYSPTDDPGNVNSLHVVVVTDVSGIFYSENGGDSWLPANNALGGNSTTRAASVAWHPTTAGLVFVLTGDGPAGSGSLLRSTDYGKNWSVVSSGVAGAGNQVPSNLGLPKPQPRNVGKLIGVDGVNNFIYVGTFDQGVRRASLNNLNSWTTVALAPGSGGATQYYIRSLVIDDQDPTVVYASTYNATNAGDGRIWRIKSANNSPVVEKLTASPVDTEDMLSLGGALFTVNAAAGTTGGVSRLGSARTAAVGASFSLITGPDYANRPCSNAANYPGSCTIWFSISGFQEGSNTTLWVGASNPPAANNVYKPFWRGTSTTGFASDSGTWMGFPTTKASVINDVSGPNNPARPWWKWAAGTWSIPSYEGTYDIGDIAVGRSSAHPVMVAGQVGIWRTTDNGGNWYPMVEGFLNLVNRELAVDPNNPSKVYQTNVDYRMFESDDNFRTARVSEPTGNSSSDGWSIFIDSSTNPSTVYLGLGDRDTNTGGELWRRDNTGAWSLIMIGTELGVDNGKRVTGVGVTKDTSNNVIIVAALQDGGLWRKQGSAAWTKLNIAAASDGRSPITNQSTLRAEINIRPGASTFFVYDRYSGLWRGDNYGTNWTRIFTSPSNTEAIGYAKLHPTDNNIVFVSDTNGVHKITNAATAGQNGATSTEIGGSIARPGAMTLGPKNKILVVERPSSTSPPALWQADYTQSTPTWSNLADDYFRSIAIKVITIAASNDGTIYAASNNNSTFSTFLLNP